MIYSYYPGCSLKGSSKEYDRSSKEVCAELGIELKELSDWICCGASSGHSLDEILNIGLPAHTLKLAEQSGHDLAVPCAACYNRLKNAQFAMKEQESVRDQMNELMDHDFQNKIRILNLLELFQESVGLEAIQNRVTKPLNGLKTACYYGCLLVRPQEVTNFDDPEHPDILDMFMKMIGADPVNWSYKAECCGGSLALTRSEIVTSLTDKIVSYAQEAGAHVLVTLCPLCLENLDARQSKTEMPVLYFTELMGLAFEMKESVDWIKKHYNDPAPVLRSLKLIS